MKLPSKTKALLIICVWVLSITGCTSYTANGGSASASNAAVSDAELQQRVALAIANASDIPQQLRVEAASGVVRLVGSLQCESCGGNRTPGTAGSIQQSIGAVVRAVPGVTQVEFSLDGAP